MALVRQEKQLTVASAMNDGTMLKQLEKKSPVVTSKLVMGLILRQAELFNIRNNISDMQAAVLASDLIEVFGYETLEDIVVMFKMARQGKLGKIYNRLDSETIMSTWVPAYLEIKAIERERQHTSRKKQVKDTECSPEASKMLDKILNKLKKSKPKEVRKYYPKFTQRCKDMVKQWPDDTLRAKYSRAKEIKALEAMRILQNEIKRRKVIKTLNEGNSERRMGTG